MENNYDVIVVGAGNAGLMAALVLTQRSKKVLLLESNSFPGGVANSTVCGRFEFEQSLKCLHGLGDETNKGELRKIFDEFGLNEKIDWIKLKESYRIIKTDNPKEEYILPTGLDDFIKKMEEYEPGCKDKVSEFFELAKEMYNGFDYITKIDEVDYKYINEKFPNFMNLASYTVDTVFKKLKLPKKIEDILKSYWIYLGVSPINLNFAHYAALFYEFISNGAYIPKNRSQEISNAIESKIREYGGEVWYNIHVRNIMIENNKVLGVVTDDGFRFYANHIICNTSPYNVFTKMIDPAIVPEKAKKMMNTRKLGARAFSINLGLNKPIDELGINNYMQIIYDSLDGDVEYENMKSINSNTMIVTCLNCLYADSSPVTTSILNITAYYYNDCWNKLLHTGNYYQYKEKIASKLINRFELAAGVSIRDFIEEVEISTPVFFSNKYDSSDGTVYGYMLNNNDSVLSRITNKEEDYFFKGLRLCGGYSYFGHGYDSTYRNGYEIAIKTLADIEGDEIIDID